MDQEVVGSSPTACMGLPRQNRRDGAKNRGGNSTGKIRVRLLKGFRDYLPEQMSARQQVLEKIRQVYERYGFMPLDTPALEHSEVLLGRYGEESDKQIYRFITKDEEDVALRFDLTVPLARVVEQYADLPLPFKRYQLATVWRVDKPDPGRFREFLQFDVDIVGSGSILADAEIIAVMCEALEKLGVRYQVRFSSRKVLNLLVKWAKVPNPLTLPVFRVLDKMDRIGFDGVAQELTGGRVDASGDRIPGLGLTGEQVDAIQTFLHIPHQTRQEAITGLKDLFNGVEGAEVAIGQVEELSEHLNGMGILEEQARIDPGLARGLDYYTGPIYEASLLDAPEFGSVIGGGRYDELIQRRGVFIPATGSSIGVDRLMSALEKIQGRAKKRSPAQVLVTVMNPSFLPEYQKIARELRNAGIHTDLYMGQEKNIGKQIQFADSLGIPLVIIAGEDEFSKGTVSVKDLSAGRVKSREIASRQAWLKERAGQVSIPRPQLVQEILRLLREAK